MVGITGTRNIITNSPDTVKIIFPSTRSFEGLDKSVKNIKESDIPNPVVDYSKGKFQTEKDLTSSDKSVIQTRLFMENLLILQD